MKKQYGFLFLIFLLFSCKQEDSETLFYLLSESQTGISFRNDLVYTEKINPYTFRNFYNGAGVAIGDINQDSLPDIFFAGNQQSNRLYLNAGELSFEDITDKAGLNSEGSWTTGVSMADVNGDGLLDIYVCKSGPMEGARRHNELFINNGDLTFTERYKEFGLAEIGLSQHAVFLTTTRMETWTCTCSATPDAPWVSTTCASGSVIFEILKEEISFFATKAIDSPMSPKKQASMGVQ